MGKVYVEHGYEVQRESDDDGGPGYRDEMKRTIVPVLEDAESMPRRLGHGFRPLGRE